MKKHFVVLVLVVITVIVGGRVDDGLAQGLQPNQKIAIINIPQKVEKTQLQQGSSSTTVTIGPLLPQRSDQAWLSKAIADLLIKNLSEVQSLIVLEREKMEIFSSEVGLSDSALFNQERALRVGRIAKVDKVVFGNYLLKGNTISIFIFLMDLKTQKILLKDNISGSYDNLRSLIKELVFRFLAKQKINISESEKENIQFKMTDSMTATEHFYRGLDFYDKGKYPEAFGEFLKASKQDTKYFEAHLFAGKMLEEQGFYKHSVLSYEKLYDRYPQTVEGRDALFFAAKILERKLGDRSRAISTYKRLTKIKPTNPHSLEASFCLGDLLQSGGDYLDAYQELKKIDDFRNNIVDNPRFVSHFKGRSSRFISWQKTLSLYKESIVKMIALYQKLIDKTPKGKLPPPRGAIVLDPNNPNFRENRFGRTKSLFPKEQLYPDWHEKVYVVLVPKDYVATGIDFSITGEMKERKPAYDYTMRILPFPLPRDFSRFWYGVIFGQTSKKTTLNKFVSFHGEKLNIFTIQLLENHSTIFDWGINVRLVSKDNIKDLDGKIDPPQSSTFWEGQPIVRIPLQVNTMAGSTRLQQQTWNQPKKELDILYDPSRGYFLVVAQGEIDGLETDLWFAHSVDGKKWSELERLRINSSSEDFNPRLIRAEDGKIWLAWISNRRGMGWELWMSSMDKHNRWSNPRRIPLEKLANPGMEKRIKSLGQDLLEYDIYQDNRGRWIIAYYSYNTNGMVFIKSSNAEEWTLLSKMPTNQSCYGASLIQDSSAVYRFVFTDFKGQLHLWSSNNASTWKKRLFPIKFWNQSFFSNPRIHRVRLFPLELGNILMLVSDNQYGLQFARFHADTGEPILDLVSRVGLEAYAVTRESRNNYLVALKGDEQVTLRQFKKFNVNGKEIEKDTRGWPIYKETEDDIDGNRWTRIFAQARRRVSDVTSLGLEPGGRLWWGIETGVMYKDKERFMATNVSLGFFYHFITRITSCCDERVWFSSKYLDQSELGYINYPHGVSKRSTQGMFNRFKSVRVPKAIGAINAVVCGKKTNQIYVGTSLGRVVGFDGNYVFTNFNLGQGNNVSALSYNKKTDELWVGTEKRGIYLFDSKGRKQHFDKSKGLASNQVIDLTVDQDGSVWVSFYEQGLMKFKDGKWMHYRPDNSDLLYWSSNHLVADPVKGIWYLPHDDVFSKGLGYFDGKTAKMFNPPHRILPKPSSLVVEPSGVVWIGTWFDGLFKLERKEIIK